MRNKLLIIALLAAGLTVAEGHNTRREGYVVLLNNDTIRGKVTRVGFAKGGAVNLKNETGKTRFAFSELKAYKSQGYITMLRERQNKKGKTYYEEYCVMELGKVRLMHDDIDRNVVYFDDGRYMDCTENNMKNHIIPELMKCTFFQWKYEQVPMEEMSRWGNKNSKMMEMIRYYNQNCP
jgi:hypothetical protein